MGRQTLHTLWLWIGSGVFFFLLFFFLKFLLLFSDLFFHPNRFMESLFFLLFIVHCRIVCRLIDPLLLWSQQHSSAGTRKTVVGCGNHGVLFCLIVELLVL